MQQRNDTRTECPPKSPCSRNLTLIFLLRLSQKAVVRFAHQKRDAVPDEIHDAEEVDDLAKIADLLQTDVDHALLKGFLPRIKLQDLQG